jgi:hypothetical protein
MLKRTAILRKAEPRARAEVPVFKPKKCKACAEMFKPSNSMQIVCGGTCGLAYAQAQRIKATKKEQAAERAADRVKRESLKTRSDWLKETQIEFNRYIRLRDQAHPCISCDRNHDGAWHGGHYLSTGARPELRFDERNVHKQCAPCNVYLSGNLVLYRAALVRKIGAEAVAALEGPHAPKHYSIDDLKAIKAQYRALARQLEKQG